MNSMKNSKMKTMTNKQKKRVEFTTVEASWSKLSAVKRGYYDDPYLPYFVKKDNLRNPLINRCYYSRVAAIRLYTEIFFKSLSNVKPIQVLNIGCGIDTLSFWILERYKNVNYFEIDYPQVLFNKAKVINNVDKLKQLLVYNDNEECKERNETFINCCNYKMMQCDLNKWESVEKALKNNSFDFNLPTLFFCECVLVYLEVDNSDRLIKKLSELMTNTSCIIVYEQVQRYTTYGKELAKAFKKKNIPLKSAYKYSNLKEQYERFKSLGWNNVYVNDMNEIYEYHLDSEETKRIEHLEIFDELEEFRLFHNHYFVLIAYNCYNDLNLTYLQNFLDERKNRKK